MDSLPTWIPVITGVTAFIGAIGVLYTKFLKPVFLFAAAFVAAVPVARSMVKAFEDIPDGFAILKEIVGQVRNDSGSSLLDTAQRTDRTQAEMQKTLGKIEAAAALVAVNAEAAKELAQRDRDQLLHLIKQLDRLTVKVDTGIDTAANVERKLNIKDTRLAEGRAGVAADLAEHDAHLASDLADARARADAQDASSPGSAADAAAQS